MAVVTLERAAGLLCPGGVTDGAGLEAPGLPVVTDREDASAISVEAELRMLRLIEVTVTGQIVVETAMVCVLRTVELLGQELKADPQEVTVFAEVV